MNWYFTFGNHYTRDGECLRDYWVQVTAPTLQEAKRIFNNEFAEVYMDRVGVYSRAYPEKEFDSQFFPQGEYIKL